MKSSKIIISLFFILILSNIVYSPAELSTSTILASKTTTTIPIIKTTTTSTKTTTTLLPINDVVEKEYVLTPTEKTIAQSKIITEVNKDYKINAVSIDLSPNYLNFRFETDKFVAFVLTNNIGKKYIIIMKKNIYTKSILLKNDIIMD